MSEDRRRRERFAHRHLPHPHIYNPFRQHGEDEVVGFTARVAERIANGIGTPRFIVVASVVIAIWIALNAVGLSLGWDPYPFILLNLAFSAQAFYACSLTVLAFKVQAARQKASDESAAVHRQEEADRGAEQLRANTAMTSQIESLLQTQGATLLALREQSGRIHQLAEEVHENVCQKKPKSRSSRGRSSAASRSSRKANSASTKPGS